MQFPCIAIPILYSMDTSKQRNLVHWQTLQDIHMAISSRQSTTTDSAVTVSRTFSVLYIHMIPDNGPTTLKYGGTIIWWGNLCTETTIFRAYILIDNARCQ